MKITKTIREYVESKVDESLPKGKAVVAYTEATKRANEAQAEVERRINPLLRETVISVCEEYDIPPDFNFKLTNRFLTEYSSYGSELRKQSEQEERDLAELRRKKVNEIILNLELGATKKDLDEMINALFASSKAD